MNDFRRDEALESITMKYYRNHSTSRMPFILEMAPPSIDLALFGVIFYIFCFFDF